MVPSLRHSVVIASPKEVIVEQEPNRSLRDEDMETVGARMGGRPGQDSDDTDQGDTDAQDADGTDQGDTTDTGDSGDSRDV